MWGVRCRALSHPRLPALWAGCRGPLPTGCGCGVVRAWGPVTNPTARALSSWLCALWGRQEGARGRAPPAWVWGFRGRALSHPRLPALRAGYRGPLSTGCGCGGVRAWGPVTNHTARALASWLCTLWGRHEGARGGASCLGMGRPGSGALPAPTARPLGGLPGPTTHWLWVRGGAGVGTRHQPHSARSFELALRAMGAARGRPGGGAPPAWVWGVRGRALSHPGLPALWAGCRGPLSTGCGSGGVRAWGPVTSPTARALASWLCALWGRHEGARGGAPLAWVWGVQGQPLSHPRLPALCAGFRGPLPTGCGSKGVRAWGPVTSPTARALASWLCALWGRHEGARGGAPLAWVWGVQGQALSHPRLPTLCAGFRGPLPTGCGCGRVQAWGPVTNPTARALVSWLCTLWGRHEGARGGASCLGVGRPGSGALPPPTARPLGGLLGLIIHWLSVRGGAGVGTRHKLHSARSFGLAFWALGAARGRPGKGASCLGVGRLGSGALPPPTARPLGGLPGPITHWLWVLGGAVVGTRHKLHSARSFGLAFRAVGAARGRPGKGASCLGVGRPVSGALPPPTARPLGGLPGPTTHWLWVRGGAGVGTRHQPHSARSFELALRAVGTARGCPGGGASCLGVGCPGSGAPPLPSARPLSGLPGPTTHWLWVRGGAGVGTHHQPHSARSCELALRAVGAARGRPGGGASCLGVGRPG